MLATAPAWAPVAVLGLGVLYYRRIRRHFGRQAYRPVLAVLRLALLAVVAVLLAWAAVSTPHAPWLALGGAIAGAVVGLVALRHTHVEPGQPAYYTPNPWLGGALAALLLGRLTWRLFNGGLADPATRQPPSPLTLGLICMLVAYYLVFGIGLARQVRRGVAAAS